MLIIVGISPHVVGYGHPARTPDVTGRMKARNRSVAPGQAAQHPPSSATAPLAGTASQQATSNLHTP